MTRFGWLLRHWRETRGLSQQGLAENAGLSTRHMSFLETDRCGPSEQTVVRLGRALELPDREVQRLLHSAGFACQWHGGAAPSPRLPVQLARIGPALDAYEPFPAFVTDPAWKIPSLNRSAHALFSHCADMNPRLEREPFDVAAIITDAESLGRIVSNREAMLRSAMSGLFRLQPDPSAPQSTSRLYAELSEKEKLEGLPDLDPEEAGAWQVAADFEDRGHRFTLELLALPFGGPCAGYGMLLTTPVDERSEREAEAYFQALMSAG